MSAATEPRSWWRRVFGEGHSPKGARVALLVGGVICSLLLMLTLMLAFVMPIELGGWVSNLVLFGVLATATLYGAWKILRSSP